MISSGYHLTFLDVQESVINALNHSDHYTLHILDNSSSSPSKDESIHNFSGINSATGGEAPIDAITRAEIVTTSVGPGVLPKVAPLIADGISKRRLEVVSGGGGDRKHLTVIACENMVRASSQLQKHVLEALEGKEEDLKYFHKHVGFADCEVDRIVPSYHPDDSDDSGGLSVGVEGFYEWIVEKKNVKSGLEIEGMQLTDNLDPFLERKLYTLNCGHAILGFLGYLKGYSSIKQSFNDEEIRGITRGALGESGAGLVKKHGFDEKKHEEYIERTMGRYANPHIDDEVVRVSRNPLRKLSPGERLVGAVEMCREFALERGNLLKGIAAGFLFYDSGDEEARNMREIVKDKGLEGAVAQVTGMEADVKSVVNEYETLKEWKK